MNSLEKTDQVIINLKVIATLSEGERLCLRNNNFSVYSPGWSQAVFRWIWGETRWVNMEDVKTVIGDAIRILGTYVTLVHHAYTPVADDRFSFAVPTPQTCFGFVSTMARELRAATKGLASLKQTYTGDQLITATFDLLIERTLLEIQKADETMVTYQSMAQTPGMSIAPTAAAASRESMPVVERHVATREMESQKEVVGLETPGVGNLNDAHKIDRSPTGLVAPVLPLVASVRLPGLVGHSLVSKHYDTAGRESHFNESLSDEEEDEEEDDVE